MKKIIISITVVLMMLTMTACGGKEKNIEGDLVTLMNKVYEGVEAPMLGQIELTEENLSFYVGAESLDFKEGLASEAMINAIAHSVVLIRMNEGADVEAAKKEIREKVNPAKWICVGVDEDKVIVDSRGDLIILILDNNIGTQIHENFKKLS
ncbi:MAG: hypothetical protein PUF50_01305 [Erysipelotrichaceae bacterium]|nr:hypothetical protein [Erysipelotrichaceae bacterium]